MSQLKLQKKFSRKVVKVFTFLGNMTFQCLNTKSAPYSHQVVSDVKINIVKKILLKSYPDNHTLKSILWSVLDSLKFTGVFADYRLTGRI